MTNRQRPEIVQIDVAQIQGSKVAELVRGIAAEQRERYHAEQLAKIRALREGRGPRVVTQTVEVTNSIDGTTRRVPGYGIGDPR